MNGESVAKVADATMDAAGTAMLHVEKDVGFRESAFFLIQLALASSQPDPKTYLSEIGVEISGSTSMADVAVNLSEEMDRRIDATRKRTDFGEMAQHALVSTVTEHVRLELLPLLQPSGEDVGAAFRSLGKMKVFGAVARQFCARLTDATLNYFLSKTLATHIGEGQRFATTNQVSQFEANMRKHCEEASEIMEQFAAEWFSKRRFTEKSKISRESAERFGWFGMQKMRLELEVRAKR